MLDKLINKHQPVLLEEIKTYIPKERKINVIDATFGGGGYSVSILQVSELPICLKSDGQIFMMIDFTTV